MNDSYQAVGVQPASSFVEGRIVEQFIREGFLQIEDLLATSGDRTKIGQTVASRLVEEFCFHHIVDAHQLNLVSLSAKGMSPRYCYV